MDADIIPFWRRETGLVAPCGCPIPPEVASGEVESLGWHLWENHPEAVASAAARKARLGAE